MRGIVGGIALLLIAAFAGYRAYDAHQHGDAYVASLLTMLAILEAAFGLALIVACIVVPPRRDRR